MTIRRLCKPLHVSLVYVRFSMDANIISFRVALDRKGRLVTELSALPSEEVTNIFTDKYTQAYVRTVLRECHLRFDDLHDYLQQNIQALKHE